MHGKEGPVPPDRYPKQVIGKRTCGIGQSEVRRAGQDSHTILHVQLVGHLGSEVAYERMVEVIEGKG